MATAKEMSMPINRRLVLLTTLTVTLAAGSHAQTLRERMQQGNERGWTVIRMKDDWKTVFAQP
jgi:hypothetical protein